MYYCATAAPTDLDALTAAVELASTSLPSVGVVVAA